MARARRGSNASINPGQDREQVECCPYPCIAKDSSTNIEPQELGSMYDYLAKVILLGPSGSGKSCLLHRIVKNEWRILSSQTIGVEFSSKIIKVGTGPRRKRIKLQLWDTAGTERFRSVSRSYYRGAAGAILVYDLASYSSFSGLPTFLSDARALASPNLTVLLAGNKLDLTSDRSHGSDHLPGQSTPTSPTTPSHHQAIYTTNSNGENRSTSRYSTHQTATSSTEGRQVSTSIASGWASGNDIPVSVEVSAYDGTGVEELFSRLARMILTKLELGEIDPDDPMSGIQYGDAGWSGEDGLSIRSGVTSISEEGGLARRRRKGRRRAGTGGWGAGMREWEAVFRLDGGGRRRKNGCC